VFNLYNMSRLLLCSISTICHDCCYVPSLQYITIVSGGAGTVNPSEAAGRSPPSDIGNLSRMLLFRLNPLVILVLMTHILFGFPILLTLSVPDENHFRQGSCALLYLYFLLEVMLNFCFGLYLCLYDFCFIYICIKIVS
jgi:hypothetical protein